MNENNHEQEHKHELWNPPSGRNIPVRQIILLFLLCLLLAYYVTASPG